MTPRFARHALRAALAILSFSPAVASAVVLDATNSGTYASASAYGPTRPIGLDDYITGTWIDSAFTWNSFFVFDVGSVGQQITGATLRLRVNDSGRPDVDFPPTGTTPSQLNGYVSPDASETFKLSDVSTDLDTLVSLTLDDRSAIIADLGGGTTFGQRDITNADSGSVITITLNAAAIAALNAARTGADTRFALGGTLTTALSFTEPGAINTWVFGRQGTPGGPNQITGDEIPKLDLQVVPLPAGAALLFPALAGLAVAARRRTS